MFRSLVRLPLALVRALPSIVVAAGAAHAEPVPRIIGGRPEARIPAIGALLKEGADFCTGTAIAPNVVLTAAHCFEGIWSADGIEFFMGRDVRDLASGRRIRVRELHPHPSYDPWTYDHDIAVAVLESDVDVEPVPARLAPLPWIVGDQAVWVGYGVTDPDGSDSGVKRSVQMPISAVDDLFVVNEAAGKNTCFGDSGGPALMDLGAGLEVIAVTSYGDSACLEDGYNSRSDVHADWIWGFLAREVAIGRGSPAGDDAGDVCAGDGWFEDGACKPYGCAGASTSLGLVAALAAIVVIARRRFGGTAATPGSPASAKA